MKSTVYDIILGKTINTTEKQGCMFYWAFCLFLQGAIVRTKHTEWATARRRLISTTAYPRLVPDGATYVDETAAH